MLENHILLLFKIYLNNPRKQEKVTFGKVMRIIVKVKDMEKESAGNDDKNMMLYNEKWQNIENMFIFF